MSEQRQEINREDCRVNHILEPYPGKFTRNNRNGSILTKEEYIKDVVKKWVEHFGDSEKYHNTSIANKVRYLVRHLGALKVNSKQARAFLVKVEIGLQQQEEKSNNTTEEELPIDTSESRIDIEERDIGNHDESFELEEDVEDMEYEESDYKEKSDEDEDIESDSNDKYIESRGVIELEVRKFLEKSDR